ncbi:hypothetical protein JB92DRAFT_3096274 [Gautieria morchelliformis]|nr:hypothetical protein JB92DRAFT_3096274 [Gautieria morchelliformis]
MPSTSQPKGRKGLNRSGSLPVTASLTQLLSTKQALKQKHGWAVKTLEIYERRLRQAREWLKEQLKSEAALEHPAGCPETLQPSEDWTLDDLQHAFDKKPNRASPSAVSLFIAWKCFNGKRNLKRGIAEQTHAAFKKFWEDADSNGLYQGRWCWDAERSTGKGNPASSPEVEDMVQAVKMLDSAEGKRWHLAAMSKEYMDMILVWSNKECPEQILTSLACSEDFARVRAKVTKHLLMIFELAKLTTQGMATQSQQGMQP